jgi:hypothetical protein
MNSLDWRLKRFKTILGLARYFKRIGEMKNRHGREADL